MIRKCLAIAHRAALAAFLAFGLSYSPVAAQSNPGPPVPAQWTYSFDANGNALATYPGGLSILGTTSFATLTLGPAQSAINQVFQATATYSNLNTSSDYLRVQTNACPITDEIGAPSASTSGIVSCMVIPAGTYSGTATWPDNAVAAYVLDNNVNKTGVAVLGAAGTTVSGSQGQYGGNFLTVNCELYKTTCATGAGFDFVIGYAVEADTNVYSKSGSVAPNGSVAGFTAIYNGDVQPNGAANAFQTSHTPGLSNWKVAYATNTGDAPIGLDLAPATTGASANSQQIILNGTTAGSTTVTETCYLNSVGDLVCNNSVDSSSFILQHTYPEVQTTATKTAGPVGWKVLNNGTGGATTANLILQTGTANSSSSLTLTDAASLVLSTGSAVTSGITLQPSAGPVTVSTYLRRTSLLFANLGTVDASPQVGDTLVISDASACTANTAVTAGGGTLHSCPVIYNGASWIAIVTH